jgi:hypothetical protein
MSSPASPTSAAPLGGAIGHMRLFGRLATGFALDLTAIVRGRRELLDALLLAAISNANTAAMLTDPELQAAFATAETPPPDELRRPMSVEAAAEALRIPVEEARWRIRRLLRRKLCVAAGGGVIVPARYLATPEYVKSSFEGYERLREFYYVLCGLGMLHNLPPPSVELSAELAPLRVVARLATDYLLRVLESLAAPMGDPIAGMVLLAVFYCNVEHLPVEAGRGGALTVQDMVPDSVRRPVSTAVIARRLGLPHGAVRRCAAGLVARGFCVQLRGGLMAPAEALARPEVVACVAGNLINLQRMFASLAQLGVLRAWDDLNPSASTPAVA